MKLVLLEVDTKMANRELAEWGSKQSSGRMKPTPRGGK